MNRLWRRTGIVVMPHRIHFSCMRLQAGQILSGRRNGPYRMPPLWAVSGILQFYYWHLLFRIAQTAKFIVLGTVMLFFCCASSTRKTGAHSPAVSDDHAAADSVSRDSSTTASEDRTDSSMIKQTKPSLSAAAQLLIDACDNYIHINPSSPKTGDVILLKASVYYNHQMYEQSRQIYQHLVDSLSQTKEAIEALRMIAQSYYEEQNFDQAQIWYRKLKEAVPGDTNKTEAIVRIAETVYKIAEKYEKEQKFSEAAAEYERVATEFPEAVIADIAVFNAGVAYEKQKEWSKAIIMYQRLKKRYGESKLVPRAIFRTAKCYEMLNQWDEAAQTYLRVVASYPRSELASPSLYNAGYCFENGGKRYEAAATFEKIVSLFPQSADAADMLFKAGELYGSLKDWEGVSRVNKEFSRRFGNDKDRTVQAQCMVGIASYMQGKETLAIQQLQQAIQTHASTEKPSLISKYYAAKADFTIGEIYHEKQKAVKLRQPAAVYNSLLKTKSQLLDKSVEAYAQVLEYGISEWTTRAIYQIGQVYEDFAIGILEQERPYETDLEKILALEFGMAQAIEEYFINNALHYYEQNVKLGIKEQIENKYILLSRKKLTYLPSIAGENYLALVDIALKAQEQKNLKDFALIAHKLQILQKIAPFQERAIALFLKCLEIGTLYHEYDEFYTSASKLITKTTYTVAQTYADVAAIAREAPIPKGFDRYEHFIYKTKLVKQIDEYEEHALSSYLNVLNISQEYAINDSYVENARLKIPELLFIRGRCYDLLSIQAFTAPPFPESIKERERDDYRARFDEIALGYQEKAFSTYQVILEYKKQDMAQGDYVKHAYARLYQHAPQEYGVKQETLTTKIVTSDSQWKCSVAEHDKWYMLVFDDQKWSTAAKASIPDSVTIKGFPSATPPALWYPAPVPEKRMNHVFFRKMFTMEVPPHTAELFLAAGDTMNCFFNEQKLPVADNNNVQLQQLRLSSWDVTGRIRKGKNLLAVEVKNSSSSGYGLYPYLVITVASVDYVPQFPGTDTPVDTKLLSEDVYQFPIIKNFMIKK